MRLKVKWVLTVSACMVGLWLLVIIALPAPSDLDREEERLRREQHQSAKDDTLHKVDVGEQSEQVLAANAEQNDVQFSEQAKQNAPKQGNILPKDENEGSEQMEEEKKVPQGIEIENIQGLPQNGLNVDQPQNETHPLEQDLLPISVPKSRREFHELWRKASSWVTSDHITPLSAKEMGSVLYAMAHAPITKADVGFKGTQLKSRLLLEGGQLAVFKPKRQASKFDLVIIFVQSTDST